MNEDLLKVAASITLSVENAPFGLLDQIYKALLAERSVRHQELDRGRLITQVRAVLDDYFIHDENDLMYVDTACGDLADIVFSIVNNTPGPLHHPV